MKQAHTILIGAETYPPDINGAAQFGHRLATAMLGRGHEACGCGQPHAWTQLPHHC